MKKFLTKLESKNSYPESLKHFRTNQILINSYLPILRTKDKIKGRKKGNEKDNYFLFTDVMASITHLCLLEQKAITD